MTDQASAAEPPASASDSARHDRHRIAPLDGLRGLAALGIVVYHGWYGPVFWFWSLVDLFFVLSGFVITRALLALPIDQPLPLLNFWMRRILRIWPVYYLTLSVVVGWLLLRRHFGADSDEPLTGLLPSLFFLQFTQWYLRPADIYTGTHQYLEGFAHSWSLAVEEQFYLIWPPILARFRRRPEWLMLLCPLLLVAGVASRAAGLLPSLLLTRIDGLALGVLLAFLHHGRFADGSGKRLRQLLISIALPTGGLLVAPTLWAGYRIGWSQGEDALGAFLQHADPTAPVLGFSLLWFALIAVVLEAPRWIGSRLLAQPWLLTLGALSYALYMFHPVVLDMLTIVNTHTGWLPGASLTVAYFALTFAAAAVSRRFIEAPSGRFKRHFPLRRERPR